jgi:hypothetical protein
MSAELDKLYNKVGDPRVVASMPDEELFRLQKEVTREMEAKQKNSEREQKEQSGKNAEE